MEKLTDKQKEIFDCISNFIDEHGYSPSIRELCKLSNRKSPCTVKNHLNVLRRKGYVTFVPNMNRTVRIIKEVE